MTVAPAVPVGVSHELGYRLLSGYTTEVWWLARSRFLCAGCEAAVPGLRFHRIGDVGSDLPPATGSRVVIGFQASDDLFAWASEHGATVVMPAPALTRRLSDKTQLAALAAESGVPVPRSVVGRRIGPQDADELWRRLGASRAVVQLSENDLTGAGTRYVDGPRPLAECLGSWTGRDVKLAEYVTGIPLTVSGIVLPGVVTASGISYQLVGYERLTSQWGGHCGNQLLDDALLPPRVGQCCRDACRRIGQVLGTRGVLGRFGLDLLATETGVVVLELNPRVQSVTSLLNAAEVAAGLLPSPGLHVLAFVSDEPPALVEDRFTVPTYGQLVRSSRAAGRTEALPASGVYELAGSGRCRWVGQVDHPLGTLHDDQALVWAMTSLGTTVRQNDRVYLVQTPVPIVSWTDGALTKQATTWLTALDDMTEIKGADW
jgi:hypothetical protein